MCQLYALNSNTPTAVTFSLTGFCARGGHTAAHADGWGIAFHHAGGSQLFIDDQPACASPLAAFLRQHPIRATTVLAHIRKATRGAVQLANCHPFQREWAGRRWSFCHNGTLHDFQPPLGPQHQPLGRTDSELAFAWLLQQLQQRFGDQLPPVAALARTAADLVRELASHGACNLLLTDGEHIYAHCSTKLYWLQRAHPFVAARLVDADLTLDLARENGPDDRMVLLATEPLTHDEPWQPLTPGELLVLRDGQILQRLQRTPSAAELQAAARHCERGASTALDAQAQTI
ncbi:MAG: class II glutamine amidotransferase [Burkholderiales bacterium PBB5]|nr:MAG: class II glutamine amidotransferase [Burkholderiales bacterium PBB5]